MKIIGCDFHPGYQQIAVLDSATGEIVEKALSHERKEEVRTFYAGLPGPVRVGMEASGQCAGVGPGQNGIPRCCRSAKPNRCRPTVVAWCESDGVSGSTRSAERRESGQSKESGAANSWPCVSGSRPTDHAAPPDAK